MLSNYGAAQSGGELQRLGYKTASLTTGVQRKWMHLINVKSFFFFFWSVVWKKVSLVVLKSALNYVKHITHKKQFPECVNITIYQDLLSCKVFNQGCLTSEPTSM